MTTNPPPIQEKMIEQDGVATMPWVLFFNQVYTGDVGSTFTPVFTGLTEAGGAAELTGKYVFLTKNLAYFRIIITPASSGSTSAVAGTTALTNFPLSFASAGICFAVSGVSSIGAGMASANDNRIYVPTWTTVAAPVTVIGLAEVL